MIGFNTSPREFVTFQLALLELYETLLEDPAWDEAKVNTTLKAFMSSALMLIRIQQSMGGQVLNIQKEMIRQYRAQLEQWLAEHGDTAGDGAGRDRR
jgi:hypothetical protein